MAYTLSNNLLRISVSPLGAELQSIENIVTGFQYLWQGDPRFWKRRSPVLFPIVGAVWNGVFRMDGCEYSMNQHGFARDMEFVPIEDVPEDELWFRLASTPETLEKYPRDFSLEIGYRLLNENITVMWRVKNNDNRPMSFQIGAHPAFNLPDFNPADSVHAYFNFDISDAEAQIIEEKGCVGNRTKEIRLTDERMLPVTADTFREDALIFGGNRLHRVSLLTKDRNPLLTLLFRSPYVGLWAPAPEAPFVCIEPWYGRADSVGFEGDFSVREAVRTLAPGETFEVSYMIIIDNV